MRHSSIRSVFGIVWLIAAVVHLFLMAIPFAILYAVLGIAFIYSAIQWKKKS